MKDAVEIVQYVNLGLYTVVAVAAVWLWWRHRERAGLWAALAFVALALIVDVGRLLPEDPTSEREKLALKVLIAGLVLFPYLLYRFATSFRPPSRSLSLLIGGITVIVLAWTFVLTDIPGEGEAWPTSFAVYVAAFTIHWTLLTVVVTYRLWTAGRGEASVPRKRMRLLAVAAATITLALLVSVSGTSDGSTAALVATLLSSLSALTFLIGLAPPAILRTAWRRPETTRLQAAIAELMGATTRSEVVGHVLPPMAEIVGAQAVELRNLEGELLGAYGNAADDARRIVAVDSPAGEVKLWTSTYTPFFGAEELALVRTLAALTALALDRARLFSHEREMREALERADEIKTNFVSLAAHELRTPVATIHGLVETIYARRDELDAGSARRARDGPARTDDADEGARRAAARPLAPRGRRGRHPADSARDPAARRGDRPRVARQGREPRRDRRRLATRRGGRPRRARPDRLQPRSSTRAATARLPSGSPPRRTTGTSASPSRTRAKACRPSSCPTCSSASRGARARAPAPGPGSASRSPARTRRRTAAT